MPEYNLPDVVWHFLELIPPTEKNPQKIWPVCFKNGSHKENMYQSKNCIFKSGLFPAPCYEVYQK